MLAMFRLSNVSPEALGSPHRFQIFKHSTEGISVDRRHVASPRMLKAQLGTSAYKKQQDSLGNSTIAAEANAAQTDQLHCEVLHIWERGLQLPYRLQNPGAPGHDVVSFQGRQAALMPERVGKLHTNTGLTAKH